jgi:hypothetical protein
VPIIIGDRADPHVQAVADRLPSPATILDAAAMARVPFTLTETGFVLNGNTANARPQRGWVRRLAPAGWTAPIREGSLQGASQAAWLTALASIVRDDRTAWLSSIDAIAAAENKPLQYRRAALAGVPVPEWMVTTDYAAIPTGRSWVTKPLGPGHFVEGGEDLIVPTTLLTDDQRSALTAAPFILQRYVGAARHARVVTVGKRSFSATLDGADRPLDWRTDTDAHNGFTATPAPAEVHTVALAAAAANNVRFSSQDWILDADGAWWFVDLNPAGQWLFLPTGVADGVSAAIAAWLADDTDMRNQS